ncbi:hypothetical protein HZB02_04065 [Candidatus Woesearchaeota archaeon]|nr:hypothetical protein [Candidatus Woesearchaeota archaeon]
MSIDDTLPQPEFLNGESGWIGIKSRSYIPHEEPRNYLWSENFKGDLTTSSGRHEVATDVTRFYVGAACDAIIGLPIDVEGSDSGKPFVAIPDKHNLFGFYIQSDKRRGFEFKVAMTGGLGDVETVRSKNPVEFDRICEQVEKALPYAKR